MGKFSSQPNELHPHSLAPRRKAAKLKPQIQPKYQKPMVLLRAAPLNNVLCFHLSLRLCAFARAIYFSDFALPARSAFNNVLCFVFLCAFAPLRETSNFQIIRIKFNLYRNRQFIFSQLNRAPPGKFNRALPFTCAQPVIPGLSTP